MKEVTVIVQTCPERAELVGATLDSIRASDVGEDFELIVHPAGQSRCRFFRDILVRMASVETPLVIRLEDDVLVCRHFLHNFLTWPALSDPLFAVGWLYTSEDAARGHTALGSLIRENPIMANAFGVGLSRETAEACVAEYDSWLAEYGCGLHHCAKRGCQFAIKPHPETGGSPPGSQCGQDTLFSRTAWALGRRVFLSSPALVETRDLASLVGTRYDLATDPGQIRAGANFNLDWRRS